MARSKMSGVARSESWHSLKMFYACQLCLSASRYAGVRPEQVAELTMTLRPPIMSSE